MANLRTSGSAKSFLSAVLAGVIAAGLFALAGKHPMAESGIVNAYLTSIPLVIASVPLFMVGLGFGLIGAIISSVTAVGLLLAVLPSNIAVLFCLVVAVPVLLLSPLGLRHATNDDGTERWYPEGFMLTAIALYTIVLFVTFDFLPTRNPLGQLGNTLDALHRLAARMPSGTLTTIVADNADYIAGIAPFIVALCLIVIIATGFVMGQGILVKTALNIRPPLNFRTLRLPTWIAPAVLIGLLATILGSVQPAYIGKNVSLIFCIPLFCQGLAVVHGFAASTKSQLLLLIIFYVVLSIVVWLAFAIALLGMADQWVDFRRRWARPQLPA